MWFLLHFTIAKHFGNKIHAISEGWKICSDVINKNVWN